MEEDRENKVRPFSSHRKSPSSKFFKKWYYTCPLASLLLLTITIIVLSLTIFKVKDPIITMNNIKITKLDISTSNSTTMLLPKLSVKLIADVSIKNPNVASFRYGNTTTTLYYHGIPVGEARGPPGRAKARRTMRMNVTIDVITDKLLGNPDFMDELLGGKGVVRMDSFSRVPGQVKMLNFIKKHVVVKMNCSSNFSVLTQQMQEMDCKRKVKIW